MIKIINLKQTCIACPTQYEGLTDNNEYVYIRYRYGYLSIRVCGKEIYGTRVGSGLDGVIELEKIIALSNDIIDWSELE